MGAVQSGVGAVQGGLNTLGNKLGTEFNGAMGAGYDKPQMANIQSGVNSGDIYNAQTGVNNSLQSQQALLQALQAQGGLEKQGQVFSGLGNTANQYQDIAQGRGPNIARSMLNQATGQNVANQAALMAGQRGAGSNVGLMARQAAQQGSGIQQQAVGQGATMQAQQQIGALQGLTGVQAQQAALANQIANQQISATNANTQAHLSNYGQTQSALGAQNNANVSAQGNMNTGNAALLQTGMQGKQKMIGGLFSGAGSVAGMMAAGGEVTGPVSSYGQFLNTRMAKGGEALPTGKPVMSGYDDLEQGSSDLAKGVIGALTKKRDLSLGDAEPMAGQATPMAENTAMAAKGGLANSGGHVAAKGSSQKAVASGDSLKNDKVPAMLSEGEVVIPRSVTMSDDPVNNAAKFVAQVLAKKKVKK